MSTTRPDSERGRTKTKKLKKALAGAMALLFGLDAVVFAQARPIPPAPVPHTPGPAVDDALWKLLYANRGNTSAVPTPSAGVPSLPPSPTGPAAPLGANPLPSPQPSAVPQLAQTLGPVNAVDLRAWSQQGDPAAGKWTTSADGSSVTQETKGQASFYVSPDSYVNATIRGRVKVLDTRGLDLIGFVLGYQAPIIGSGEDPAKHDYVLVDWKGAAGTRGAMKAEEGLTLSRVEGPITADVPSFFAHQEGATFKVLSAKLGRGKGWTPLREYTFELVHRKSRVKLSIDGQEVLNATGSFPEGRIGFYTYSQGSVVFSGVTTQTGNTGPVANAGPAQTLPCGAGCSASVTLDGTASSDPDGDVLSYTWTGPFGTADGPTPTVTFPQGVTTVTLTVDDGNGATGWATTTITVLDTQPPTIACPAPLTVQAAAGQCQVSAVALGAPTVSDNCAVASVTNDAPQSFPVGTTTVSWGATDTAGLFATCTQTVTVSDGTPPTVKASVSQPVLWPPDHKMVDVGLNVTATDPCGLTPTVQASVWSNEPDVPPGTGDDHFAPDAVFSGQHLSLRSERLGDSQGRVYLVIATATDPGGTGIGCATSVVPHDQSAASMAIINGLAQTAMKSCAAAGTAPPGYVLLGSGTLQTGNQPPRVDAGVAQTLVLPTDTATLTGTVTDDGLPNPPGIVTSQWSLLSGPGTVTFKDASSPVTTATFSAPGSYVLQLAASDSQLSASATVPITVKENLPPVVSAGPNQTITLPTNTATLAGTATDDGLPSGILNVYWSQLSGPQIVTFSSTTSAKTTVSFGSAGAYVLRLTASDTALQSSADVTVTVTPPNQPPVVSAGPSQTAMLPSAGPATAALVGTVTDDGLPKPPGAVTVEWSQVSGPGAATFANATSTTTVASFSAEGIYVLRLSASDGALSASSDTTVTVVANKAPVVNAGPNQVVALGASGSVTLGLNGTATDDGLPNPPGALTLQWTSNGPAPVTFANAAAATTSATFTAAGTYTLQLQASDSQLSSAATVSITVRPAGPNNQPPVVNAGPNQTITLPTNTATLAGSATDDGLPSPPAALTLAWTQTGGPAGVVFANPASASTSATFPGAGTYGLRLTASDSELSSSADVFVTVRQTPANQPPVVSAGPNQTITLPTNAVTLQGSATDDGLPNPPGALTLQWTEVSGPGPVTFGTPLSASTSATFSLAGAYLLRLTASDSQLSASSDVTVTVQPGVANLPPVVNAGPDQTVLLVPGSAVAVALQGSATDDGLPNPPGALSLAWSELSGPAGVTFEDPFSAVTTATFGAPGTYVLELAASDSQLVSTSDVTIAVNPAGAVNQPPVVSAGPNQNVTFPSGVTLSGTASDDGLPNPPATLTVSWQQVSGPGIVTFADPAALVTTASFSAPGSYDLRLTASDSQLSASSDVVITVEAPPGGVNKPPVVSAGPNQTISMPTTLVVLPGSATDDGLPNPPGALAISWSMLSGPAGVVFGDPTLPQTTATFSAPGTYVLQLKASDGQYTSAASTTITVNQARIVGYQDTGYRYKNVASGTLAGFEQPGFDDSSWATGSAGWGDTGFCELNDPKYVKVFWPNSSDMLLRRHFVLPEGQVSNLSVGVAIDNDVQVWVNGQDISGGMRLHEGCPSRDSYVFPIPASVLNLTGDNLLAVRGRDRSGLDYLDVRIGANIVPLPPPTNQAPVVSAGDDQSVELPTPSVTLNGSVADDGMPAALLVAFWNMLSGPGNVSFGGPSSSAAVDFSASSNPAGAWSYGYRPVGGAFTLYAGKQVASTSGGTISGWGVTNNSSGHSYPAVLYNNKSTTVTYDAASVPPATLDLMPGPNGEASVVRWTAPEAGTYVIQGRFVGIANMAANVTVVYDSWSIPLFGMTVHDSRDAAPFGIVRPLSPGDTIDFVVGFGPDGAFDQNHVGLQATIYRLGTTTASFSAPGTYVLRLTATDGALASSSDVTVTVLGGSVNQPPVVDAGPDQTITLPRNSVTLAGTVADDGLPTPPGAVTVEWSGVSGPAPVSFANAGSATTTATFTKPGTYTLRLTASDSALSSASDVRITVLSNLAPQVFAGPNQAITWPANTVSLSPTVFDDGLPNPPGALTLTWSQAGGPGQTTFTTAPPSSPAPFDASGGFSPNTNPSPPWSYGYEPSGGGAFAVYTAKESMSGLPAWGLGSAPNTFVYPAVINNPTSNPVQYASGGGTTVTLPAHTLDLAPGPQGQQSVTRFTAPAAGLYAIQGRFLGIASMASNVALVVTSASRQMLSGTVQGPLGLVPFDIVTSLRGGDTVDFLAGWTGTYRNNHVGLQATLSALAVTTASFSAPGGYVLRLTASDGAASAVSDVTVTVNASAATNQAPVVSAGPNQTITLPTNAVTLAGSVTDDGLPNPPGAVSLAWSEVSGPGPVGFSSAAGATIQASFPMAGSYVLRLTASDGALSSASDVTVTVNSAPSSLSVSAGPDQTITLPTNTVSLQGSATSATGASLTVTWSELSGPGTASIASVTSPTTTASFDAPGVYVLRLTASDGVSTASSAVTVVVQGTSATGPSPSVAITSPAEGAVVTSRVDIVGSVGSGTLFNWTLAYRRQGDVAFTRFATGTAAVSNARLATFDPTLLLNGIYEVRLTATDTSARTTSVSFSAVVRDNQKVGAFTVSFVDLEVPVSGLPVRVTRTYDSRDNGVGDFGFGWRLDLSSIAIAKTAIPGDNWQPTTSGGIFPTYCLAETKPHVVTVTFPGGAVQEFQQVLAPQCQALAPLDATTVTFAAVAGSVGTLAPADGGAVLVDTSSGQLFGFDGALYNPTLFLYTAPDGRSFLVDAGKGLQSVRDLSGNTLTVSRAGITYNNAAVPGSTTGITFQRDPATGAITSILDPSGASLGYGYDGNGNLTSFKDRAQNTTSFGYGESSFPHYLTSIKDPLGRTPITNTYYPDGRIESHTDALGKTITYQHDLTGRQEVVTDRNGNTRVLNYDERGNVVKETQADGKVVLRTFDARNNRLSETLPFDPAVTTTAPATSWVYDANNNVRSVTDPLGHATRTTYDSRGRVLTTTDPLGKTTVNAYDAKGNLLTTTDASGSVTSSTYDAQGNVKTRTVTVDGVGQTTSYGYDALGRLTSETDPAAHTTSYTYDGSGNRTSQTTSRTVYTCSASGCAATGTETVTSAYHYDPNGRLTQTDYPDGTSTKVVYDALGKQKETDDHLGHATIYSYDEMGRLTITTYVDGTTESSSYDPEGRRLTSKDRAGHTTSYAYDAQGRLVTTTYADGASTTTTYDAAGRLVASKDARGKTTSYSYDDAGRRTTVTDPLSHTTSFGYDANGNQTTVTDPKVQTTTYVYDASNRRVKTIFPDQTFTSTSYDSLGRRRSETDQAGRTTGYGYDALGRLVTVTDVRGQVTSYGYDELGNRITQTDANGHVTGFEYDKLGRELARILPDGKRESKAYDAAGNLRTRVDFLGRTTTYAYDSLNRLQSRSYAQADGTPAPAADVAFTYTPTGRRLTVADAQGTTSYAYDVRDRLQSLTYPDGRALTYGWDGNGNRTSLTAQIGTAILTTSATFDDAGRLATVTDPLQRSYSLGWDGNGNRQSLGYPNGTSTVYQYNTLKRLTSLTTTGPLGTVQRYAFTLAPTGNRTRIDEADGTTRAYTYDDLYRLTSETVTINGLAQYSKGFVYDPVGNRQSQTTTGAGAPGTPTAPGTISYGYDARDRITAEGAQAYTWDDNGNLVTKDNEATYVWDFENRLVRVTKAGTVIEHVYDADGNRVRTKVTPATGPPTTTNFLVDTSGALSQVVAESDETGSLKALYVRGDDLLSVMRPNGSGGFTTRFFHADGIGSIRRLTDEAGNITDGYSYSAFGELLAHTGTDPQPYAFAGEPPDPNTAWQYHRARWMDPRTGRFAGADPFDGRIQDPKTMHHYLYAGASPVDYTDPSGMDYDGGAGSAIAGMASISPMLLLLFLPTTQVALVDRPTNARTRLLVGAIYAESGTTENGGENADEKIAIGWTFVNMAYYAPLRSPRNGRQYNDAFGDGTLLSAIRNGSVAYGEPLWSQVMTGNDLKSYQELDHGLTGRTQRIHYNLSVEAAQQVGDNPPMPLESLSYWVPIQFNRSGRPPNPRRQWEVGQFGRTHFFAFKPGRELE